MAALLIDKHRTGRPPVARLEGAVGTATVLERGVDDRVNDLRRPALDRNSVSQAAFARSGPQQALLMREQRIRPRAELPGAKTWNRGGVSAIRQRNILILLHSGSNPPMVQCDDLVTLLITLGLTSPFAGTPPRA